MKKMRKIIGLMAALVVLTAGISGCGQKFDAAGYTKACMDAMYKGDFKEYAKLLNITEEEAKQEREGMAKEVVNSEFMADPYITDEQKTEYQNLILEAYSKVKYEVGEAKKSDDGFEVTVTAEPAVIISTFMEGLEAKYTEAMQQGTVDETQIYTITFAYFKECIDKVTYGEKTTTTVRVDKNSNNEWQISEDEMLKLEDVLLPSE